jgi:uncharacterized protein YgbK (DUF1537 family)
MKLGCIGDDFTGSGDLANTLAAGGLRTVLYCGVPEADADPSVAGGVVALKTRSIPPLEAVAQSLKALYWLREQGCRSFFFKYCSTFDSTPDGNIGPVAEALANALGATTTVVCPAFPRAGRTVYQGHLFVHDRLLNESGMEKHPLTPMPDADIRRWLALQTTLRVAHVSEAVVAKGSAAIREALRKEQELGPVMVVVDAIKDDDLIAIGEAAFDVALLTGGSGLALGLPALIAESRRGNAGTWRAVSGKFVVLSGSCSTATRSQVEHHLRFQPAVALTAASVIEGSITADQVADCLIAMDGIPIAYSSADPDTVRVAQRTYGRERAASAFEAFFASLAIRLFERGVTGLVVAGGETSGAVVEALGIDALEIGPEIDPGVPLLKASSGLTMALKSGNFGGPDFFARAVRTAMGQENQ